MQDWPVTHARASLGGCLSSDSRCREVLSWEYLLHVVRLFNATLLEALKHLHSPPALCDAIRDRTPFYPCTMHTTRIYGLPWRSAALFAGYLHLEKAFGRIKAARCTAHAPAVCPLRSVVLEIGKVAVQSAPLECKADSQLRHHAP